MCCSNVYRQSDVSCWIRPDLRTALSVKIAKGSLVDDLRLAIKKRKEHEFQHIAEELILWKVSEASSLMLMFKTDILHT